jgi:hypothetical protein
MKRIEQLFNQYPISFIQWVFENEGTINNDSIEMFGTVWFFDSEKSMTALFQAFNNS